ncbi:MAG: hypothetical protein JEZ11_26200 [Desulfobacterales bacterium]|nr:hypothetical protein [Desulfobacterales bacterium]
MKHDSGDQKTLADLFRAAIALEEQAGAIYDQLSHRFAHVPEIHAFWKGMQADEIGHAEALETIRDSQTAADLSRRIDPKMWSEAVEINRFLSGDRVRMVETLDDAYMLAHEIEFSEVNAIFKFLAVKSVSLEARSDFVLSQIRQHQEKITSFNHTFGDRAWRRSILASGATAP